MKNKLFLGVFALFLSIPVFAQTKKGVLKNLLQAADSIRLVSHITTEGPDPIDEKTGEPMRLPILNLDGQANEAIIQQSKFYPLLNAKA